MQLAICKTGCLFKAPATPPTQTSLPTTLPVPQSTNATVSSCIMALQMSGVPGDYRLKEGDEVAYIGVP
ncbi:MAG: hypothetical protein WCF90_06335 [Methanomicrobiales archaeon]